MLTLDRNEDAMLAFVRIYTTYAEYKDLPSNKTVEFSSVCTQIARLKSFKGDLQDAKAFFTEAMAHAEGENEKKDLANAIEEVEREMELKEVPAAPVKAEHIPELSHEFDHEDHE